MNSRVRSTPARAPCFVTFLDLEVVEDLGQIPVRADHLARVRGHDLLVRECEHHVSALAILQLEQLVDLIATGTPPDLGRMHDRHQHLLTADRVHLLPDDLNDALVRAPTAGSQDQSPAPICRTSPARTINLWLRASASAGASRSVGSRYSDRRVIGRAKGTRAGGCPAESPL